MPSNRHPDQQPDHAPHIPLGHEGEPPVPQPADATASAPASGHPVDLHKMTDSMYAEARRIAGNIRKDWTAGETLTATALVNSSVARMMESGVTQFNDRHHYRAMVARTVYRELVDAKRASQRQKRGGRDRRRIAWDDVSHMIASRDDEDFLSDLVDTIERIAGEDHRNGEILKMKVLGAMNLEEIGDVLGMSRSAVEKHWAVVRRRVAAMLEIDEPGDRPAAGK